MSTLGLQCCVLLICLLSLVDGVSSQEECKPGWFGHKCEFLCHCSTTTCMKSGDCPQNGTCELGYFGPACQYVNVGNNSGADTNPGYLRDNSPDTCSTPDTTLVTYGLSDRFRFSWLRLLTTVDGRTKPFELKLNGEDNSCPNRKTSYVGQRFVDVTCDTPNLVTFVVIVGDIAAHICSIYISGGRNVALKQRTSQSSTFSVDPTKSQSFHAVDGNTHNDHFTSESCSNTNRDKNGATWTLNFNREQRLFRFKIYNRINYEARLAGFTLKSYSKTGEILDTYTEGVTVTWLILEKIMLSQGLANRLTIKGGTIAEFVHRVLTLCEVEIYGESLCPDGTYGLNCEILCPCPDLAYCDTNTGGCDVGCPLGMFGFQCNSTCPLGCLNYACHPRFGSCYKCSPGYVGENCTMDCPFDTYGYDCLKDCSTKCIGMRCNHITGSCTQCADAKTGPECEDCLESKYGADCSSLCPTYCAGGVCNKVTGDCYQCLEGRELPKCNDFPTTTVIMEETTTELPYCPEGKWDKTCANNCPIHCAENKCDRINGACFKCKEDRIGARCEYSNELPWLYLVIAGIIILLFVSLLMLLKRRKLEPLFEDE